jgi:hypothetical protein
MQVLFSVRKGRVKARRGAVLAGAQAGAGAGAGAGARACPGFPPPWH